jgi:hypothetical protein
MPWLSFGCCMARATSRRSPITEDLPNDPSSRPHRHAQVRAMKHADFTIGGMFWCGGRQWRCTDIGTRTIIAIRLDSVDVGSTNPELRRTLGYAEAEADGWFKGPPYAVAEDVFDEDSIAGCTLAAEENPA